MKARRKTTRWLLSALLFGLIAATGLTIARHHGVRSVAKRNETAPSKRLVLQPPTPALLASIGGKHLLAAPAGAHHHRIADSTHFNTEAREASGHSGSPPSAATAVGTGSSNAHPGGDSSVGTQFQGGRPVPGNSSHPPRTGAGDYAYNGYAPLDCELPAGCGVGATGYGSRPLSGTSAGLPSAHDSQGSNSDGGDSVPQTSGGTPKTNDSGVLNPPGQNAGPSGPKPPVAAAPELDPAVLAGAVTLLLGSLAVLRGRRRARVRC